MPRKRQFATIDSIHLAGHDYPENHDACNSVYLVLVIKTVDRHRGSGRRLTPATPPCMRVRTRRFDWLRQEPVRELGGAAFRAPRGQMQGGATQAMSIHRRGAPTQQMPPRRPEPFGRVGIAGDLCVARRQRCIDIASSSRLDLASHAPRARPLLILGRAPRVGGLDWSSHSTVA